MVSFAGPFSGSLLWAPLGAPHIGTRHHRLDAAPKTIQKRLDNNIKSGLEPVLACLVARAHRQGPSVPVVMVWYPGCDCCDCHEAQKSCYNTVLHITAHITILEPVVLSRVMDHQVWLEAYLRDTSRDLSFYMSTGTDTSRQIKVIYTSKTQFFSDAVVL